MQQALAVWVSAGIPLLVLAGVLVLVEILLEIHVPRAFLPIHVLILIVLFGGLAPFLATGVLASSDAPWPIAVALSFDVCAAVWLWSVSTGALMQSWARARSFSDHGLPDLPPGRESAVAPKMPMWDLDFYLRAPDFKVDRVRWLDIGCRRAVTPTASREAASFAYMRSHIDRDILLWFFTVAVLFGLQFGLVVIWPTTVITVLWLGITAAQHRVVFAAVIDSPGQGRFLHVLASISPRLRLLEEELEPICKFGIGTTSWIAYRHPLERRILLIEAPLGGGPKELRVVGLRSWRKMLVFGSMPGDQ